MTELISLNTSIIKQLMKMKKQLPQGQYYDDRNSSSEMFCNLAVLKKITKVSGK